MDPNPQYALRDICAPSPPQIPLPRAILATNIPIEIHESNFCHLSLLSRGMTKPEFWSDAVILERIFYKNKNQHRQGAHFWKLSEVDPLAEAEERVAG